MSLFMSGPWLDVKRSLRDDSHRYLTLADNLLRYSAFGKREEEGLVHTTMARLRASNGTSPQPDANGLLPEHFRTPGYPAFLAAIEIVTEDARAVVAAQCLLGASLALMVASIALAFGIPRRGAILAGVLWALHPALVTFDLLILTESLFNFCTVLAIFLAARARGAFGWCASGLLMGLAGLVRPLGLLYLPFALLLALRRQLRWTTATLMIMTALVPSALWAFRNSCVGEGFRVCTVGDVNLLYYTAGYALSEEKGEDWLATWPDRVAELSQRLERRLVPGQDVFSAGRALALEELKARPIVVARMEAKSTLKLFVDHSIGELLPLLGRPHTPSGLFSRFVLGENKYSDAVDGIVCAALLWSGFNMVIFVASAAGMIRLLRRGEYSIALACGLLIGTFILATMSVSTERMRLPMMLPLFLLAASAVWPPEGSTTIQNRSVPPAVKPIVTPVPEGS
jgi:4-amino-4-deoxy-L-arabinose transferase-like glycosyltransferase